MTARHRDESIDALLAAYLEDELDPSDRKRVEEHLARSPADREDIAFQRALSARLATLPEEQAPADFARRVMQKARGLPGSWSHRFEVFLGRFMRPALVTAGALAAWLVLAPLQPLPTTPTGGPALSRPVNSLALLEVGSGGAMLSRRSLRPDQRQALSAGQVVHLAHGSPSILRFPGGVTARLQGGTTFHIADRRIDLRQGKVRVQVRPGIGDFSVHGPEASAHVIGTEFEVESEYGHTCVTVHEGVVEVRRPDTEPVRVTAGQTVTGLASGDQEPVSAVRPAQPPLVEATSPPSDTPEGVPTLDTH